MHAAMIGSSGSGKTTLLHIIAGIVPKKVPESVKKKIAILRALGATRRRILTLICAKAMFIGLVGSLLGFVVGHALSAVGSAYLNEMLGQGIHWVSVDPEEWLCLLIVVVIAFLAGLVPAFKAYSMPMATNPVAG